MSTSSPLTLLPRTGTSGVAVVNLASPRVNSPPCGVSNRKSSNNDDCADILFVGTEPVSINSIEGFCWRICLKSTEILMHVLFVCESTLQSKSNPLCSQKHRHHVHNDNIEDIFSSVYIPSMSSSEVSFNRREELEHQHVEVLSTNKSGSKNRRWRGSG